eukprot:357500-Chlamydomonas_euryale.AAC.6
MVLAERGFRRLAERVCSSWEGGRHGRAMGIGDGNVCRTDDLAEGPRRHPALRFDGREHLLPRSPARGAPQPSAASAHASARARTCPCSPHPSQQAPRTGGKNRNGAACANAARPHWSLQPNSPMLHRQCLCSAACVPLFLSMSLNSDCVAQPRRPGASAAPLTETRTASFRRRRFAARFSGTREGCGGERRTTVLREELVAPWLQHARAQWGRRCEARQGVGVAGWTLIRAGPPQAALCGGRRCIARGSLEALGSLTGARTPFVRQQRASRIRHPSAKFASLGVGLAVACPSQAWKGDVDSCRAVGIEATSESEKRPWDGRGHYAAADGLGPDVLAARGNFLILVIFWGDNRLPPCTGPPAERALEAISKVVLVGVGVALKQTCDRSPVCRETPRPSP